MCFHLFFCAFILPDLLKGAHGIFVSPLFLPPSSKGQATFCPYKELTLICCPLFRDPISLFLFRPLRTLCTCMFSHFFSSYITLPTPLSPSQTHFFISTPTLSTHWCNGADSEEIKRSGKKKKKENVGMHMHSLSLSLDQTSLRNPTSSVFPLYFREHKFSATGYKFPLQHATGCHFVFICCWSLAKIIPLTHAHTDSLLPPHHHRLTRPRSQARLGSG